MKRAFIPLFATLFILPLILQVQLSGADERVSLTQVLTHPDKYAGKVVTLQGTATKIKPTTSKSGSDSTTFILEDETGKRIHVFTKGHPPIIEGHTVTVTGTYLKQKKIGRKTSRHWIEARNIIR